MSWNERLLVSQAIGCATGLVLALLFVLLLARAPRQSIRLRPLALLIFCGLNWNFAGLACALVELNGGTGGSLDTAMKALAAVSGGVLPVGLVVLCRDRLAKGPGWLFSRWSLPAAIAPAVLLTASCITTLYWASAPAILFLGQEFAIYQIAFTAAACSWALLRAPQRNHSVIVYSLATAGGAFLMAAPMLLRHVISAAPETRFWLIMAKQDGGLLMMIGSFFLFGNFRFAHIFVKQGLRILAVAISAPFLWFALAGLPQSANGFLIASGFIATVWLLFPLADRGIGLLVDRFLLRRPDYQRIARETWEGMNRLESEQEILQTSADAVRAALALEECAIRPVADVSAQCGLTLGEGDIHETCSDHSEVLVPVRTGETVSYIMVLRQHYRQQLLSGEVRFLLTMASQVGSRLEALRFERERMERQNREARLHSEIVQAELKALRAQINPHFLFNSLNAIADLIVADPARAEEMTLRLAKVFRYVLTNTDRQLTSVAEEMEFLRSYLGIEEARFGGRLRVSFHVDQGVKHVSIPCLLLQPVVENAIKHGLAPKIGDGHLAISARRNGEFLCLAVEDDGLGPPPKPLKEAYRRTSTGLGLRNVTERLKTLYDGRAQLHFEGEPMRGSRVTITIPCAS